MKKVAMAGFRRLLHKTDSQLPTQLQTSSKPISNVRLGRKSGHEESNSCRSENVPIADIPRAGGDCGLRVC